MTVFVLGLDGADWSVIRRFTADGRLPNFTRIIEDGSTADLQSTHPPITCPAWQSYATGKNPGKLGVYGWVAFDRETCEISFNGGETFTSKTYFELLADRGYQVGLVNMPTTYPAEKYEGVYTIAGHPGEEDKRFTNPPSLREELRSAVDDYSIDPTVELQWADRSAAIEAAEAQFGPRFDAAEWLVDNKECDIVHLTLFATDTIQHHFWDDDALLCRMYERVDELLGRLLDRDDADAVFLMSDHGFTARETTFSPNQWLVERGDLHFNTSAIQGTMEKSGLTRQRLKSSLRTIGVLDVARTVIPASVRQRYLPNDDGSTDITNANVDWTRTKAVSLGHGPIYVNERAFDSRSAIDSYRSELKSALKAIETPAGKQVVESVYEWGTIYTGTKGTQPDFIVEYTPGVDASNIDVHGPVFGGTTRWTGVHRQTGIFAAIGDGISRDTSTIAIDDIAPTILHYLSEPVPADMDGEVNRDVLAEPHSGRERRSCPSAQRESNPKHGPEADVENRLRDLGYL